jgi:hypothetical protein
MSDRRVEIEDPARWPDLPPDDPLRRELEARPSARSRVRAYREFMAAGNLDGSPERAEAEARLAAAIDAEIGVPGAAAGAPAPAPVRAERAAAGREPRRPLPFPWLGTSRLKPLVAVAAVVVAAAGAGLVTSVLRQQQGDTLRGTVAPGAGAWDARPLARVTPNAGLSLSWAVDPDAEHYTVVFISDDLTELDRVEGITGGELILTREALPRGLAPGSTVSWRVLALRGTDEVGRSPAAPVTLP